MLHFAEPSSTSQTVFFAAEERNKNQPPEQQSRDKMSLQQLTCGTAGSQDVPPLLAEQQVAAGSHRSPAAAHEDSLLRMVTVLDALAAEQMLMVSAAL